MARDLFELASLFVGVAFAALLIGHASQTATVVEAVTRGFGMDLATVELAGGYAGSSGMPSQYGAFTTGSMMRY